MIDTALIAKILGKYGLAEHYREQEPAMLWDQLVGEKIAQFAKPIWVHKGVLFVAVPNHIVQHEFNLMREEFKKKLNTAFESERVREIRFRVENFPKPQATARIDQIELSSEEERDIESLVSDVPDASLRASLARLMKKAKKFEKARQKLGWRPCSQCGLLCEENFCPICSQEGIHQGTQR